MQSFHLSFKYLGQPILTDIKSCTNGQLRNIEDTKMFANNS